MLMTSPAAGFGEEAAERCSDGTTSGGPERPFETASPRVDTVLHDSS